MKLSFKIDLKSDYHIGSGYGRGIVDSALLKDKDGLPIIRGTTLVGLLRQGMWDLLKLDLMRQHHKCEQSGAIGISYCSDSDDNSMCPVCRILGNPAYAKKWRISSAEIEESSILRAEKVVWRNRVNPITRSAETNKLFNEETAGDKINFVFNVNKEANDLRTLEEASFIIAAFRMIRNIGSSRRRGKGLCQIHLVDINSKLETDAGSSKEDKLLNIFQTIWLENKPLILPEKNIEIKSTGITPKNTKKSFNIVLLTKEPLLIASRSESGNSFHTHDYIPGYTILGALAWKAANRCDLNKKDIYEKFINLFRRNKIKISPMYPCWKLDNDIYPSVHSPYDLLTCKLYPGFEWNGQHGVSFATDEDKQKLCDKCLEKGIETSLEPLNKFISLRKNPEIVDVATREELHISIDQEKGIIKKGDLFSYNAIESGQYLIGAIDIENWENFVDLLGLNSQGDISFELGVGKSSTRGYGNTMIWLRPEENPEDIIFQFQGKTLEKRVKELTEPLTMTLMTDAILMDKWGRFYSTLDTEMLLHLLGLEVKILNNHVKSKNIDGFNSHLGLPRWRDHAISAGSSIQFMIKSSISKDDLLKCLARLEKEGIGLRKEEGFGKIAFNHSIYSQNEEVNVGIRLPDFMRISTKNDTVMKFEDNWKDCLKENLIQKDFDNDKWRAVSRWLRENSKKSIDEIKKQISNFHTTNDLTDLVKQRQAYRNKKNFLDENGKDGLKSVLKLLGRLSIMLENEEENIRQYLQIICIEMLADFIVSLRGD